MHLVTRSTPHDGERIPEAARMGGAEEIIERLPEGYKTYLERPVARPILRPTRGHEDALWAHG